MTYSTADAAVILEEALPPSYWADVLLSDIPDEFLPDVKRTIDRKSDAEKSEIALEIANRQEIERRFFEEGGSVNIRGCRLPIITEQISLTED